MANCGWIIDTDHLYVPGDSAPADNEAGVIGPHNIASDVEERLKAGEGRRFRMYDADGVLQYSGRLLTPKDPDGGGATDFRPLDDFGKPNAACTSIWYYNEEKDAWEEL